MMINNNPPLEIFPNYIFIFIKQKKVFICTSVEKRKVVKIVHSVSEVIIAVRFSVKCFF